MKKRFLVLSLLICFGSAAALAAKYTVNSSGKVTNPNGQTQNSSTLQKQASQQYNTYSSQTYTQNKVVLTGQAPIIDIVMDYSGSMSNWINAAKVAMTTIVNQIPQGTKIGFRTFGQDSGSNPYSPTVEKAKKIIKKANGIYSAVVSSPTTAYLGNTSGYCAATKSIVPVTTYNPTTLLAGMNMTKIGGATPLTYALHQAVNSDLSSFPTTSTKKIVLITDGDETCGGDPCAFVRDLVSKRKDIIIDVVLVSAYSNKLKCLSDATGGKFYTANDTYNFSNALTESITNTPAQSITPQTQPPQQQPTQQYEYTNE